MRTGQSGVQGAETHSLVTLNMGGGVKENSYTGGTNRAMKRQVLHQKQKKAHEWGGIGTRNRGTRKKPRKGKIRRQLARKGNYVVKTSRKN